MPIASKHCTVVSISCWFLGRRTEQGPTHASSASSCLRSSSGPKVYLCVSVVVAPLVLFVSSMCACYMHMRMIHDTIRRCDLV